MNLKHLLSSTLFIAGVLGTAHGQFNKEALLFSQEYKGGTARFKGMGNVQTALGGDISSISGNPAGLGFFGQSDIAVTFNYFNNNAKTNYFGQNNSRDQNRFQIDNAGAVFHFPSARGIGDDLTQGWLNFNVGLSYDKTNNFAEKVFYSGTNPESTIGQFFSDDAYRSPNSDWERSLIGSKFITGYPDIDKSGYFPIAKQNGDKYQENELISKGDRSKTSLSFGANYSNTLFIGATFSMTSFRYTTYQRFTEEGTTKNAAEVKAENPNSVFLDPTKLENKYLDVAYAVDDYLDQHSEGSGFDFKLGMIYKPAVDWNLGVTIKTPTWLTVQDDKFFTTDFTYTGSGTALQGAQIKDQSPDDIRIITPFEYSLGVTKFFPRGLLTVDADLTDYSTTRFRSINFPDQQFEDNMKASVKDTYKAAINARIGGEYLITNILSGRAGFNYYGNPYKNADYSHYSGSVGLGLKLTNALYLDLAVVQDRFKHYESPYVFDEEFWGGASPVAEIKNNRTSAVLTLGAKF